MKRKGLWGRACLESYYASLGKQDDPLTRTLLKNLCIFLIVLVYSKYTRLHVLSWYSKQYVFSASYRPSSTQIAPVANRRKTRGKEESKSNTELFLIVKFYTVVFDYFSSLRYCGYSLLESCFAKKERWTSYV